MRRVHLPAVYSKLAALDALAAAGLGSEPRHLSRHQLETYLALTRGNATVVFNTAITGDGKSLAGLLPMLKRQGSDCNVMAMYPTNELIRDQCRAVEAMRVEWQLNFPIREVNSLTLDRAVSEAPEGTRGDALLRLLQNGDLILSNPDVFHYIMQMFYTRKGTGGDAPDKVLGRFADLFVQMTFDEFHVFETPQVVSVINALLFLMERGGPRRYLFLSATPDPLMQNYLARAGFATTIIPGCYHHGENPGAGWRLILRAADLHIAKGKAEEWVMANAEGVLLPFFRTHVPGAKGAIIVNSVATALRLTAQLRQFFRDHNFPLTVEPNTGLTGPEGRERSYQADLLVATSTVDVGVDFRINFLIFESRDGGSFLQRLGRLGRHGDFTRPDGATVTFDTFVAHALVPDFVFEHLFEGRAGEPPLLSAVEAVDRERFNEAIRAAFPRPTDFRNYARRWGLLQSAAVIYELNNKLIRDSYAGTREQLAKRYQETFGGSINYQFRRMREEFQGEAKAIFHEARSFRGGSPWQAVAVDETQQGRNRLVIYDLRQLLANYHASLIEWDEFAAEAARWGEDTRRFERADPIACLRLHALLPQRRPLSIAINDDLGGWDPTRFDTVTVLKGLEVEADFDDQNALNRKVRRRPFVSLVTLHRPSDLQRRLYLPWPFPIERLVGNDGIEGSVAFAREALLLEAALHERGLTSKGAGAIIV
ncbi:MAG: type I-D CRISPR-associated helicase Cas3' [Ardenticatenaceae bacterium]|nr:type I-D CRISPR-associated helicase Cas3' [Ardenticatenaceae bacterium]